MSIPFCVASALLDGAVSEASFADLGRAPLLRLIALTTLEEGARFSQAFPARQGAEVMIELSGGARHSASMDDLQAATPEMVAARFAQAAHPVIGAVRGAEMAAAVSALESLADVGALMRLSATEA
jgi:hypothetical protein